MALVVILPRSGSPGSREGPSSEAEPIGSPVPEPGSTELDLEKQGSSSLLPLGFSTFPQQTSFFTELPA